MITNEIYFFKNQSSVSTSDSLYNVNDGTLILQVDGDVSNLELSVLGNTDLIDDDFVTLKTINASDYNMSDKITSTGIYWIDINGIRKIKLNLSKITGSVNVKAITKRGLTTDLVARAMAANSAGGGSYTLPVASASTLGGIKVGENLTIDENGVLSAGGGEPEMYVLEFSGNYNSSHQYNATDNDKIRVAELITTLKEDANVPIYVKFKNGYGLLFTPLYDIQPGQQPYYLYQCLKYNNSNLRVLYFCSLNIYGTWENDIFTVSTCIVSTDTNGFLSTGTQSSINDGFNPTLDQHPATKKYVDDAVASAGGGNGKTSVYKIRTNMYSYSFLSTIGSLYLNSDADKFTEFINSIGDGKGTLLYLCGSLAGTTTGFDYIPEGYLFTLADDDSIINKTNIKFVSSFTATDRITTGTHFISTYVFDLSIRGSWTDGVFTCTSVVLTKAIRYSLPTNNTSAYTPTNNYHPATKKYVDDNSFKLENENIYVLTGNIDILSGSINTDDLAKATEIATDIYLKTQENPNYAYNIIVQCNGDKSKGLTVYMSHLSGRNDAIIFIGICFYNGYWREIRCTLIGSFDTSTNKYNVTKIDMSSDYTSLQVINPRNSNDVANKQYVDNAIKTAITTSLEGSY